jgi:PAS domain S-box-containing protein
MSSLCKHDFAVLNYVDNAVFVTDHDLHIVFWSDLLTQYSKLTPSDVSGKNLYALFPHLDNTLFKSRINIVLDQGLPQAFSSQLNKYIIPAKLPDGSFRVQNTTVTRFQEENNSFLIFSIKDITEENKQIGKYRELRDNALRQINERIKVEEKLKELNSSKDRFFSIISHDLKSPLSALLGFVQILHEEFDSLSPEEVREFIASVNMISRNINDLVLSLLDWSRIQLSNALPQEELVPLPDIFSSLSRLFGPVAGQKEIALEFQYLPNQVINIDKNMLLTVMRNLLSNALKFTNKGGKVTVIVSQSANGTTINVNDNGVGIPEENLKNLFRIDKKISTTGTGNETGTGLGLLLCKDFVEANNGTISVESEVGKGSSFTISFPA